MTARYFPIVLDEMKKIGIYEDVMKVSVLNRDGFWFRTPYSKSNEVLATLRMGKLPKGELRYEFAAANLGQDDLAELILMHAQKLPNFSILWSHRFAGVKQDANGTTVCAATPKGEVFLHADYVVGCDGASSAVRRCLCIPFEGFTWDVSFEKEITYLDRISVSLQRMSSMISENMDTV
jgi:2-polyprenyl-6-methoxyphenol hydroxylase-like FAD-dependent oxidoreductase